MGGDTLTESGGCTFLLSTRAGPVPQVLLANTSGIHSKAGEGLLGEAGQGKNAVQQELHWVGIQTLELPDGPQ